jgi:serine/threonine protein kinase
MFAVGVLLFIFSTGCPPFHSSKQTDKCYQLLVQGDVETFWSKKQSLDPKKEIFDDHFQELFESLVAYDEDDRPSSYEEILENQWL